MNTDEIHNIILGVLTAIVILVLYNIVLTYRVYTKTHNIDENYRLLEISPAKKCSLGPYTWGSPDSELYKFCSNPETIKETQYLECQQPGFYGAPVHWDYTPESDDKWSNRRCSKKAPPNDDDNKQENCKGWNEGVL